MGLEHIGSVGGLLAVAGLLWCCVTTYRFGKPLAVRAVQE
jgi:hypothetical protein